VEKEVGQMGEKNNVGKTPGGNHKEIGRTSTLGRKGKKQREGTNRVWGGKGGAILSRGAEIIGQGRNEES